VTGSGHGAPGRCFLGTLLLITMVSLSGLPSVSGTAYGEGTFNQETCSLCHIRDSVFIDPSYLSGGMREVFNEERLCMSCHNGSVRDSRRSLWRGEQHPALPGGEDGQNRSCSVCHSPHEKGGWEVLRHTAVRLSGGGDPLCTGCHKEYGSRGGGLHETGFPNGGCSECHRAHGGTGKALLRVQKESICHRCHEAQWRNRSGGHPSATLAGGKTLPVALPECTACHPVHRKTIPEDFVDKRCAECHEAGLRSRKATHRPGETCLSCHSFHARSGAGGKGLRKSDMNPSLLCGKCHGEVVAKGQEEAKRRGTHPVEDRGGTGIQLCLRCHRIHNAAQDTPMLATNKAYFCLDCHEEQNTIRETRGIMLSHPVFERIAEGRLAAAAKAYRLVLGPTGEIVCGTCHSIHRSVPGTPLLEKGFDQAGNCFLCHEALRKARHAPSPGSRDREPGCASCHKVHGIRTTKEDPWKEVCSACHHQQMAHLPGREDRKINRPKGIPEFDKRGRAVEVGGEISCPTCHDPHGTSEIPKMLRKTYRSSGFLCTACHRDKETVALTSHDLRGIAGDGICETCHKPHGGSYPWMWGRKRGEGDPAEESCRSCHREKGMGFPVPDGGHPSGMIVVRPLPDRFPLYGEGWRVSRTGVLTCSTCHLVHGDASAPRGGDRNPLLRNATPSGEKTAGDETFCRTCHPREQVSHGNAGCSACHPTHPKKEQAKTCDSCHPALSKGVAVLHLRKGSTCRDCHRIHEEGDPAKLESRCTACHTRAERIRGTPHADLGERICDSCHPSHREPDDPAAGRHSYEEVFRPDQACKRCHYEQGIGPVPGWMEHPKARKQVPTNYGAMVTLETPIHMTGRLTEGNRPLFPLFDADGNRSLVGRMGCLTCHDPHLGMVGNSGGTGRSASAYLRDPSGIFLSEICVPCHRNDSGDHAVSFHKLPRKTE